MILFEEKSSCYGCASCFNICPNSSIIMQEDKEGFIYPHINTNLCINCKLCKNVCPFKNDKNISMNFNEPIIFAAKHNNKNVLKESSSGGMFTALSDYIIELKGVVYAAFLNKNFDTLHIRATTKSERNLCRGSKYTQSTLADIHKQIENDLVNNKKVLFIGTPCQVDGVKRYIEIKLKCKEHKNLLLCDLICHGVPSTKMFKEYISYYEKEKNVKIKNYYHRGKYCGWGSTAKIECIDGSYDIDSRVSQLWVNLFYRKLISRPSCYKCKFSSLKRTSDLTIGDYWGIEKIAPDFMDKMGVSLVLINTSKGKKVFYDISHNLTILKSNIEHCIKYQTNLNEQQDNEYRREDFYRFYNEFGYKKISRKYIKWGIKANIKYCVKTIICKLGLLEIIKKQNKG